MTDKLLEKWAEGFDQYCTINDIDSDKLVEFIAKQAEGDDTGWKDTIKGILGENVTNKLRGIGETVGKGVKGIQDGWSNLPEQTRNLLPYLTAGGVAGGGLYGLLKKPKEDESRLGNMFRGGLGVGALGAGASFIPQLVNMLAARSKAQAVTAQGRGEADAILDSAAPQSPSNKLRRTIRDTQPDIGEAALVGPRV